MQNINLLAKARRYFYRILVGSIILTVTILILLSIIYSRLFFIGQFMLGTLKTICGCTNYVSFANHPYLFSGLLFLGVASIVWLSKSSIEIIKFRKNTKKFVKVNLKKRRVVMSSRIKQIAQKMNLVDKIIELEEDQAVVFCYGIFHPNICISSGILKQMSNVEIQAVLLHEKQHILNYEPAKLMILKICEKIFFFFPGFKILSHQYIVYSELAADELATASFAQNQPLAQALAKIIDWEEHQLLRQYLAVSFFSAALDERINYLLDKNYISKNSLYNKKFLGSVLLMLGMVLVIGSFLFFNGTVLASHGKLCLSKQPVHFVEDNLQYQSMNTDATCKLQYSTL